MESLTRESFRAVASLLSALSAISKLPGLGTPVLRARISTRVTLFRRPWLQNG